MYTALTKLSQPLGCCVAVGGPPVLPQLLGRKIKPHLRDTPVHCLGGAADATFPASDCKHVVDSVLSAALRAGQESEIPNFKASYLGRFPLVSADFWTSDHLSERSRSVDVFSVTRTRGTLTLKRR